ncbi:MAG: hypothetical protein AAF963_02475 [Bacteroidota bacterium]
MKKLSAFLIVFLLALASATYLYYAHWRSEQQVGTAVPYIPQSAALVYEVTDFNKQWENFQQTAMSQALAPLPALGVIQQTLGWLKEELAEDAQKLAGVPLTLSVHGLGEAPWGYLFYFNTHDLATQRLLEALMTKVRQDQTYRQTTRKYAGYKITTLSKQGGTHHLSYIKRNQYIIASFSSLLIEDIVRTLASRHPTRFLRLQKSANPPGSLYINLKQLPQLLRPFVTPGQLEALSTSLATFAQTSQLNIKLTSHHLLFSGLAQAPSGRYLTHTLASQQARSILLAPYVPQNTAVLQHLTFSDAQQLVAAWQQYRAETNVPKQEATDLLTATLEPLLQGEVGHCTLAASQHMKKGQLVFMKVTNPQAFTEALKGAHLLTALSSHPLELPANSYQLKTDYFQHWLPGPLFPGFEARYLTQVADYIVLANSPSALQTWYTQYRQGRTWANNPNKHAWLASTLDQAHLTWVVDLQKVWQPILQALQPQWQPTFKSHTPPPIDASLQLLSDPSNGCYVSILIKHHEESQSQATPVQPAMTRPSTTLLEAKAPPVETFFQAKAPLIHAPWLVKSHLGKGHYVLLQDAQHQLHFLDPAGKLLWKKALEGPVTTDVLEMDFFKNNKTQYLFATDQQLYLLDYYGRKVSRYPQPLPQPTQLQVVDYNRNKHYRFLMATAQGNIYLKDKHYRPLTGWNPKALGHEFTRIPFHLRARGRDYFLALQTNGVLQVLNRRGQTYPGFPVDLKESVSNPLVVRQSADGTVLTVLTDDGKQMSIDLAGQIQETTQLNRTESTSRFIVCPNRASGDQYAIVRQDADKVAVMDAAMNLCFEVPYTQKQLLVQYYNFGDQLQFYMLSNPEQQLTYLYDHKGQQLNPKPWPSDHTMSLIFSKEKHQLQAYSSTGTKCVCYLLPLMSDES